MTDELKQSIYEYLTELRDGGGINMWGAGPYLMERFGLDRHQARDMFLEWTEHCRKVPQ
jgi:hypothetical protein